jgi:hypothetical protein
LEDQSGNPAFISQAPRNGILIAAIAQTGLTRRGPLGDHATELRARGCTFAGSGPVSTNS